MNDLTVVQIPRRILATLYRNKCLKHGAVLLVVVGLLLAFFKQGEAPQHQAEASLNSRESKSDIKPLSEAAGKLTSKSVKTTVDAAVPPVNKTSPKRTKSGVDNKKTSLKRRPPSRNETASRPLNKALGKHKPLSEDASRKGSSRVNAVQTGARRRPTITGEASYPPIDLERHLPPLRKIFKRTVIVSAASSNHVEELGKMVATVQMHMPTIKIVVYDLGLTEDERKTILRMCNVMEVRDMDYTKYPKHVKDLLNYAWKPPIVKEALYEFGAIFWADTSIRFKGSIFTMYRFLKDLHGFIPKVANYGTKHLKYSNYNKTHPAMFRYFGVDRDKVYKKDAGDTPAVQGGRILFVNSSYINEKLLQPWVDCAMVLRCIAPKGSQNPHLTLVRGQHVHRYDQSALSILIYKNLRGLFKKGQDASSVFESVACVRNKASMTFKNIRNVTYCS